METPRKLKFNLKGCIPLTECPYKKGKYIGSIICKTVCKNHKGRFKTKEDGFYVMCDHLGN